MTKPIETLAGADATAFQDAIKPFVANLTGMEIEGGVGFLKRSLSFGGSANVQYEMNAGGQPLLDAPKFQFVDNEGKSALVEHYRFFDDTKAIFIQYGKNRGDGVPGSPTFGRKSLNLEKLVTLAFYGGKDSDGTTTAFAHAGYLSVTAEEDQNGSNEISTYMHLRPGSTMAKAGAGNGVEINSKAQMALGGPNQVQFGPGVDHQALLRLGPAGVDEVPLRLTPAARKAAPVEGGLQLDATGRWWMTIGLAGTLADEAVVTAKPCTYGVLPTGGGTYTSSLRQGADWAELTVVVGGADFAAPFTINLPIAPALAAAPLVVGSYYCVDGSQPELHLQFRASANSVKITSSTVPLKAGQTYVFCMVLKQP